LRETYYGGVEGETVARPRLILDLLVIDAAHERICGCVERGRVGFVGGGHVPSVSDDVEKVDMTRYGAANPERQS
jgi:hypothetical protein